MGLIDQFNTLTTAPNTVFSIILFHLKFVRKIEIIVVEVCVLNGFGLLFLILFSV